MVAPALPVLATRDARLPQTYEAARVALAECERVDECKDWADKAQALASYARQADDETLEKLALRIRARATRRAGELLKQFQADPRENLRQHADIEVVPVLRGRGGFRGAGGRRPDCALPR